MDRLTYMRRESRTLAESHQRTPYRVYTMLRSAIRNGTADVGTPFVEDRLIAELDASRNSVREALRQLAQDRLVKRVPRQGTRVDRIPRQITLGEITLQQPDARFEAVELDQREIPTSIFIGGNLAQHADKALMVEYLIRFDGEPLGLQTCYWRAGATPRRPAIDTADYTLAGAFESAFGCALGQVNTSVEAVACDPRTAKFLALPEGAPILLSERDLRDREGMTHEVSYTYYSGAAVHFRSMLDL